MNYTTRKNSDKLKITVNISVFTINLIIVIDNCITYRIIDLYTMAGVNCTSYFFIIILTLKIYYTIIVNYQEYIKDIIIYIIIHNMVQIIKENKKY